MINSSMYASLMVAGNMVYGLMVDSDGGEPLTTGIPWKGNISWKDGVNWK